MKTVSLTFGIPTLGNRVSRLQDAVASALAQLTPARIVIACQGDHEGIQEIKDYYKGVEAVRCVDTAATCSWENWLAAARACETPYFAWLQDDDTLNPVAARRMVAGLEHNERSSCYLGRLGFRFDGTKLGHWWQATGPMVPMDLTHGEPVSLHPAVLAAGGYVTSHALSPAVAFKATPKVLDELGTIPNNVDIFNERMVLAIFAQHGFGICDAALVGHWVQHEGQDHRRLNRISGEGVRQYEVMARWLEPLVNEHPPWQDLFRDWIRLLGPPIAQNLYNEVVTHVGLTENIDAVIEILRRTYPDLKEPVQAEQDEPCLTEQCA